MNSFKVLPIAGLVVVCASGQSQSFRPEKADTLVACGPTADGLQMYSPTNGSRLGTLGKNFLQGGLDVKILQPDICVLAARDNLVMRLSLTTKKRVGSVIQLDEPGLMPFEERKLTVISKREVVVWFRRLCYGIRLDLITGQKTATYYGPNSEIDGLATNGSVLYGVGSDGKIYTFLRDGGSAVASSDSIGRAVEFVSQPLFMEDAFIYVFATDAGNSSTYLRRFKVESGQDAVPKWDRDFSMLSVGWARANNPTRVAKGHIAAIVSDSGSGFALAHFFTGPKTFRARGVGFRLTGLAAANTDYWPP
ncbi:MAG: hypothetical protein EOP09_13095 [Proteobacteria bacterium]|nr:MAG: hypothetical protein EOP09_13095 [Pseudomonadota bacterium]